MPDMSLIAGAISSLKSANDIAKGLFTLRDGALVQSKVIELQSAILSAQSSAIAAQSDQFELLETIRRLETKVAEVEAWGGEAKRYNLSEISPGITVYLLREEAAQGEPAHALCPNCFSNKQKSILQFAGMYSGRAKLKCHSCSLELNGTPESRQFPFRHLRSTEQDGNTIIRSDFSVF